MSAGKQPVASARPHRFSAANKKKLIVHWEKREGGREGVGEGEREGGMEGGREGVSRCFE